MNKPSLTIEHIDKKYQKTTTHEVLLKVTGLTFLFAALISIDFGRFVLSDAISGAPIQVMVFAFVNTLLLSYFVLSSRWTGWKQWGAVFTLLYGMVYVLTVAESLYLGSLLPMYTVFSLIINGAVISAIFSAVLVWAFWNKGLQSQTDSHRLQMPMREWIWKILTSATVYLILFLVFGVGVYMPLGNLLDPVAYATEQSVAASAASFVLPIEVIRGVLWTLFAVPAIVALPFGWKKTSLVIGLLMAIPLTLSQFLLATGSIGLQIAHSFEIAGANLVFGFLLVWILHIHHRLPNNRAVEMTGD